MPHVVPQLKTITLGGAVAGLGIESSSFRSGMPHESVLEMEILTPDGEVVLARPDNEHSDLFHGFPNSYGTLGYALRLRIELAETRPFVALRHVRYPDAAACAKGIEEVCADGGVDGGVDFVDGTVFGSADRPVFRGRSTVRLRSLVDRLEDPVEVVGGDVGTVGPGEGAGPVGVVVAGGHHGGVDEAGGGQRLEGPARQMVRIAGAYADKRELDHASPPSGASASGP
jgi:FAD/FMN-containing dehydrogenase